MSSGEKDSLELLKQKEIFDGLINEWRLEINNLSEEINFNDLLAHCKVKSAPELLTYYKRPLNIHNDIKNGRVKLRKEETIQEESLSQLNEILKGDLGYKSKD